MKTFIRSFLHSSLCVAVLAGCGEPKKKEAATSSTTPTPLEVPSDTPLYFKLALQWESDTGSTFEEVVGCSVPAGTFQSTCTVKVPEARLYYSNVRIITGTKNTSDCAILSFEPYYYLRSVDGTYLPPDALASSDTVDCSVPSNLPLKCYGGAAPSMITSFPANTGMYILTQQKSETGYDLKSENKTRWYGNSRSVNYLVNSDLDAMGRAATVGGNVINARVGDSFKDYTLTCTDLWAKPTHKLTVIISDENVDATGGLDEYDDWF